MKVGVGLAAALLGAASMATEGSAFSAAASGAPPLAKTYLLAELGERSPSVTLTIPATDMPQAEAHPKLAGAFIRVLTKPQGAHYFQTLSLGLWPRNSMRNDVEHSIAHGNYAPRGKLFGLDRYQFRTNDGTLYPSTYLVGLRGGTFVRVDCPSTNVQRLAYCHLEAVDRHSISLATEMTPASLAHWAEYVDEFNGIIDRYTGGSPASAPARRKGGKSA